MGQSQQIVNGMDDSPRGKLLSAAARLFREQGFDRTTVRDIAREVGIQSGSLFHHFPTKEDILYAVMGEVIRFNTERLRQAIAGTHDPVQRLRGLIRAELQAIIGDTREAMSVLVYEWRCLTPEHQKDTLALRAIYEQLWMDTLEGLRSHGRLRGDAFIIRRLITGMTSWSSNWFDAHGNLTIDQLADIILERVIGERTEDA
ncbi:MAG: TetR/AcrR family transcriptional regulator [Gammaproteobacteria bacterium HGW-Gammaproteobacteria-14]|nr:MAG: TetR/AcrR family transcriptional regulator [Gammaproteobacteria bacterium HGW-Gammaproteobacteria-14]